MRGLDRLDEMIVRVTTWISLVFLAMLVARGAISGEARGFLEALNPAGPAAIGVWMLARGRARVVLQLAVGGVTVSVTVGLFDIGSRYGAQIGLLIMAIVGALMVRRRVIPFMVTVALGLFAVAFWWNVGGWDSQQRVSEALGLALAFLLASGVTVWLKRELLMEGRRRSEATAALAMSEEQFRRAFESSAAGMMLLSIGDYCFLETNEACRSMLGYSADELGGMTIFDVTDLDDHDIAAASLASVAAGEVEHSQTALRYVRGNASMAYGLVSAALVTDGKGHPCHIVAQVVDTSERHAAEQRLMDLLTSRDELIASVSHELRTPLTAMLGYAHILAEGESGTDAREHEGMLREIVDQGSDLAAIIEDLLVFAQSDSKSLSVNLASVEVGEQIDLVFDSLRALAAVDDIEVLGSDCRVVADPMRLRQVMRNLISNARRYGGDSVAVEVNDTGPKVTITVSDNGHGVPMQDRERIFEPYQRSKPQNGLTASIGVGLTVARRLARLMGGDLTYDYRGGLSRFELSLPGTEAPAVASNVTAEARVV